MKKQIIRHGEVLLVPTSLPKEAALVETTKKYVLAHSETGHHHVLESLDAYKVYTWNGETYIELGSMATLFHEKTGNEVHTPHKIVPAIYKVDLKREFDYFQQKIRQVRD